MDHPFKVGEIYIDRIGAYEVVRIDENQGTMIIRYVGTGEESESKIETKDRILQNMQWDDQMARQEKEAAEARYHQGYGEEFAGLLDTDFKSNVEGTTWRSRASLGGRVAQLLSAASSNPTYTFLSWAIYRWPVVFLSHREHYQMASSEMGARKAKFTVELDEQYVYYGFYIERFNEAMDHTWDWPRFWQALHDRPELQDLIATIEIDYDTRFVGRAITDADPFHIANPPDKGFRFLWDEVHPAQHTVAERLQRLQQVPQGEWVDLYFVATTTRDEAVGAKVHLAHTIANTMKAMLPLYTAATRP